MNVKRHVEFHPAKGSGTNSITLKEFIGEKQLHEYRMFCCGARKWVITKWKDIDKLQKSTGYLGFDPKDGLEIQNYTDFEHCWSFLLCKAAEIHEMNDLVHVKENNIDLEKYDNDEDHYAYW